MVWLVGLFFILLVYAPTLWVRYVLWRYSKQLDELPGTGAELARHLVERFELAGVEVIRGGEGEDYYSPDEKKISLGPSHYDGKSIAAVSVAAHEVGHAIQFVREEPVSLLRKRYMARAAMIRRLGGYFLVAMPVLLVLFRSPAALLVLGGIAVATMLVSVLMYAAVLPEEYDASFNKALPILEAGYLEESQLPAVRRVLRACAMTYLASALAEVLSLWRWLRFLR